MFFSSFAWMTRGLRPLDPLSTRRDVPGRSHALVIGAVWGEARAFEKESPSR